MKGKKPLSKFIGKRKGEAPAEEPAEEGSESDESASEEEEEALTAIERKASRLDAAKAREQEEARAEQEELQLQEYETYELPDAAEAEAELAGAPNLPAVRRRIQDVARVLSNFKRLRQPGRSRTEYMERLMADLAFYYGHARSTGGRAAAGLPHTPCAPLTRVCAAPQV